MLQKRHFKVAHYRFSSEGIRQLLPHHRGDERRQLGMRRQQPAELGARPCAALEPLQQASVVVRDAVVLNHHGDLDTRHRGDSIIPFQASILLAAGRSRPRYQTGRYSRR
jgi:hypothetical protein